MSKGSEAGRLVGRTNLSKDRGDRSPQSQWAWVGGEAGEAGRGQSAQGLETTMKGGLWQDSGRRILGQEGLGKCQLQGETVGRRYGPLLLFCLQASIPPSACFIYIAFLHMSFEEKKKTTPAANSTA